MRGVYCKFVLSLEVNIIQSMMSLDKAKVQAEFLYGVGTASDLLLCAQHAFKFMRGL